MQTITIIYSDHMVISCFEKFTTTWHTFISHEGWVKIPKHFSGITMEQWCIAKTTKK